MNDSICFVLTSMSESFHCLLKCVGSQASLTIDGSKSSLRILSITVYFLTLVLNKTLSALMARDRTHLCSTWSLQSTSEHKQLLLSPDDQQTLPLTFTHLRHAPSNYRDHFRQFNLSNASFHSAFHLYI